jgi:RIO kinase 1
MFYEGVLLMELVVDAHGHPAPRLVDARVPREHAAALYADLRAQAVRMLACDLIHGDLSPYNVLLGRDGPVVIDFPQVVGAAHNSQAESFFRRDLENLRRFFAALDPALRSAEGDAHEIWRAYVRRELTPDFVPTGRPAPPPRREHRHPQPHPHARGDDRGQRRSHPPTRARPPGRREPDRRAAPEPVVVRVSRSPTVPARSTSGHAPPPHAAPHAPAPHGAAPQAPAPHGPVTRAPGTHGSPRHASGPQDAQRGRRRRRRR